MLESDSLKLEFSIINSYIKIRMTRLVVHVPVDSVPEFIRFTYYDGNYAK